MFDEGAFFIELNNLIELVRSRQPTIRVRRYEPYRRRPGDDDLIWYFAHPDCPFEVQLDPDNEALFIISTDEHPEYYYANTVEEAAGMIERWLHLTEPNQRPNNSYNPSPR